MSMIYQINGPVTCVGLVTSVTSLILFMISREITKNVSIDV
jgi:hypothetical protein